MLTTLSTLLRTKVKTPEAAKAAKDISLRRKPVYQGDLDDIEMYFMAAVKEIKKGIEAIADPYAMRPQTIIEEQESRRELYDGLKRLTQREQTYLLYRYGFTDGEEHPLIGTAIYFHLTKGRAKKTEEQAMDNLWLELPWWFD